MVTVSLLIHSGCKLPVGKNELVCALWNNVFAFTLDSSLLFCFFFPKWLVWPIYFFSCLLVRLPCVCIISPTPVTKLIGIHRLGWLSSIMWGDLQQMEVVSKFSSAARTSLLENAAVMRGETLAIFRICYNLLVSSPVSKKWTSLFRCGPRRDIKSRC